MDVALALVGHARGDHHRDVHDPAAVAAPHVGRVEPDGWVRRGVERARPERLDHLVELAGDHRHLGLTDALDPEVLDEPLDAPRRHAADVALGDGGHDLLFRNSKDDAEYARQISERS